MRKLAEARRTTARSTKNMPAEKIAESTGERIHDKMMATT
eukprot:CAMPEP_0184391696 /NCGR_PEP_ID=MMETSP0007-20130409/15133_1 /TAXON_ID=97485 /ORGANISM="Prymnesium parvum, Strain Texoma1" /LENGTH=39 /DNA_ID= /DNA_START= /DNA_END= /DNA_ORIENTATION=